MQHHISKAHAKFWRPLRQSLVWRNFPGCQIFSYRVFIQTQDHHHREQLFECFLSPNYFRVSISQKNFIFSLILVNSNPVETRWGETRQSNPEGHRKRGISIFGLWPGSRFWNPERPEFDPNLTRFNLLYKILNWNIKFL